MHRLFIALTVVTALTFGAAGPVLADNVHTAGIPGVGTTGQPDPMHNGVACGNTGSTSTPGNSVNSPGSPFNPNNAKTYAGNPGNPNPDKTGNLHPVSQYDVACFQQTQNGH